MLEIRKKQMVTTRKKHECYGCVEEIEKGKSAVYVSAKEDGKHIQFHLHEECNKTIAKDKWFSGSGLYRGCIKDAVKNSEELKSINISSLDELPFVLGLQKGLGG
ncbi:hypothetical protein [Lysinibacillus varians]|uniref:Uncharacterized protein n=1 Tax=Lysinibacillus varians TaxID=1145276 RepID=A0ABY2T8I5_9BACI|nr:hypothetical protein [Lysinibacillus varians]AHN24489.1 hypothetical protein T479_20085 [Lysinibacillus varians]TKI60493.1 hypothetical protein FC752_14995 [Lysinibacillus varians]